MPKPIVITTWGVSGISYQTNIIAAQKLMCCLTAFYHLIKARVPINNTVILSSHPTPTLFLPACLRCPPSPPCTLACSRLRTTGVPLPRSRQACEGANGTSLPLCRRSECTAGLLPDCFTQPRRYSTPKFGRLILHGDASSSMSPIWEPQKLDLHSSTNHKIRSTLVLIFPWYKPDPRNVSWLDGFYTVAPFC